MTNQRDAEQAALEHLARHKELGLAYSDSAHIGIFLAGAAWAAPKWIKCSERLPEALETVLVMLSGIAIPCYGYRLGYGISYWAVCDDAGELDNYLDNKVSHWMPLPKAPEEEK